VGQAGWKEEAAGPREDGHGYWGNSFVVSVGLYRH